MTEGLGDPRASQASQAPQTPRVEALTHHGLGRLADGTLVRVLPDHEGGTLDVHALYPSHRSLSAKVRAFVDALAGHMRNSRSSGTDLA